MKITKEALGKRIKHLRKKKGLSQDKLADRVGIDAKHLSRIETGRSYPSMETMMSIARALGVEVQNLFEFAPHKDTTALRKSINDVLKRADENDLQIIFSVVKAIVR